MARFGRQTWSLVVPDGWLASDDEECVTLVASHEVGALQISAAFKDTEIVDSDLRDFAAEHLDAGAKPRPTEAGEFVGFEIAFGDDERFWRQWFLRNGHQLLFVTYNCDPDSRGVEDGPIRSALASLVASGHDVA